MKALKIIGCIIVVIAVAIFAASMVNKNVVAKDIEFAKSFDKVVYENQLVPQKDSDGNWVFNTDKDLKVLQLTDVHIGGGFLSADEDKMALNAVAAMVTAEKPDLVIITGDMVFPVPYDVGTISNRTSTEILINLMETLGVYYTVTLGNHDSEIYSTTSREEISDMWGNENLTYSIYHAGPESVDGYGNQIIKVKNSQGIVKNAFFLLDSHSYTDGDYLGLFWKYDSLHKNQIKWYEQSVLKIDKENKAIDPECELFSSLAFLHIPVEEYGIAWDEYKANGYKDTDNVKLIYGGYHETDEKSYCGVYPEQFFETVLKLGSTKGLFCGHDHINNAVLDYKGVKLVYGNSIDYTAYSSIDEQGAQRGCTVITLSQQGELSVSHENYYSDKYISKYDKEEVTMQW